MARIAFLALLTLLAACSTVSQEPVVPGNWQSGLPNPSELEAPPRQVSGSHAPLNRTLSAPGNHYSSLPGFSANAGLEPSGDTVLHGSTSELCFLMYELSSSKFTDQALLTQLGATIRWDGPEPAAPEGVYIGLPNHADDRWHWVDARTLANNNWEDVAPAGLQGLDPLGGTSSYVAVVNYSSQDAALDELRLRFDLPSSVAGDEWLYYTSRDAAAAEFYHTSISRVDNVGGAPEILLEADLAMPRFVLAPVIADLFGNRFLLYGRETISNPVETYMTSPNGTEGITLQNDATDDVYPAGFNYGDNHGLLIHRNGSSSELWAANGTTLETGRLSQPGDVIGSAVWDLSADTSVSEYAAVASVQIDAIENRFGLVAYSGNGPFNIDATPLPIHLGGLTEDSQDPFMVELAYFQGQPEYWIYFAARNRDDATYNIYRIRREFVLEDPQPVIIDAAYEERYPTITANGRYLAYMRAPAGSSFTDNSEIVVTDLFELTDDRVVATDAVAFQSWYDPTP